MLVFLRMVVPKEPTFEDIETRAARLEEERDAHVEGLTSESPAERFASIYNLYYGGDGVATLAPGVDDELIDHIRENKDNYHYIKDGDTYKVFGIKDPETGNWQGTPRGQTPPKEVEHPENSPVPEKDFKALPDNLKPLVANLPPIDASAKTLADSLEEFFEKLSALDFSQEVAIGTSLGALLSSEDPATSVRLAYTALIDSVAGMATSHLAQERKLKEIEKKRGPKGRRQLDANSWLGKRTLGNTKKALDSVSDLKHPNIEAVLGDTSHWSADRHKKFQRQIDKLTSTYSKDTASALEKQALYQAALNKVLTHHRDMGAAEGGYYTPKVTPSKVDMGETHNVLNLVGHMGGLPEK